MCVCVRERERQTDRQSICLNYILIKNNCVINTNCV